MHKFLHAALALLTAVTLPAFAAKQEVVIGIGTQNTTTNTVTGGVVDVLYAVIDPRLKGHA